MAEGQAAPAPRPSVSDRRQHERRPLRVAARIVLGDQAFEVRTLDISAGGIALVAPANPRPGLRCRVEWPLPQRPRGSLGLAAEAQVMHSVFSRQEDGFKVGLRFTTLEPEAASAIVNFLKP